MTFLASSPRPRAKASFVVCGNKEERGSNTQYRVTGFSTLHCIAVRQTLRDRTGTDHPPEMKAIAQRLERKQGAGLYVFRHSTAVHSFGEGGEPGTAGHWSLQTQGP